MSADATGWVFRHSPFRGAAFTVHLAVADSCNDQHGNEFWMRQTVLAKKARTSRKTVGEALAAMVERGFLELVEEGNGGANRYLFLFPECAVVHESRTKGATSGDTPKRRRRATSGDTPATTGGGEDATPRGTEPKVSEPNGSQPTPAADAEETEQPDAEAREIVTAYWDWCTAQNRPKPTLTGGNPYMALVKIVARLLEADWSAIEIKHALVATRAFTLDALTFTLRERRDRGGPRAPITTDRELPSGRVNL